MTGVCVPVEKLLSGCLPVSECVSDRGIIVPVMVRGTRASARLGHTSPSDRADMARDTGDTETTEVRRKKAAQEAKGAGRRRGGAAAVGGAREPRQRRRPARPGAGGQDRRDPWRGAARLEEEAALRAVDRALLPRAGGARRAGHLR